MPNEKNDNIKFKILAFIDIYGGLFEIMFYKDLHLIEVHGIPKPGGLGRFVLTIQKSLIKEMGLGLKTYSNKKFREYKNSQFKFDLELESRKKARMV